eukprot:s5179_g6.t1
MDRAAPGLRQPAMGVDRGDSIWLGPISQLALLGQRVLRAQLFGSYRSPLVFMQRYPAAGGPCATDGMGCLCDCYFAWIIDSGLTRSSVQPPLGFSGSVAWWVAGQLVCPPLPGKQHQSIGLQMVRPLPSGVQPPGGVKRYSGSSDCPLIGGSRRSAWHVVRAAVRYPPDAENFETFTVKFLGFTNTKRSRS